MNIIVKDSTLHGLGVFACIDFAPGDVIERCPYLVIDDDDLQEINRLNDYLFTSPDNKDDYLCVLGCGMIYMVRRQMQNGKLMMITALFVSPPSLSSDQGKKYCMIMAVNIGIAAARARCRC